MRERIEEWKIINHCNEIYGACWHKMRFCRFLNTNMKNTSTDEGNKPEMVCKYDDQDRLSDLDNSQESSLRPVHVSDIIPPLGALDVCTPILECV
jgi:hypothetical protein